MASILSVPSSSTPLPSKVTVFSSSSLIADRLCYDIALLSIQSISQTGAFTLALSGGSVATQLSNEAFDKAWVTLNVETPQWDKWHVFLADERIVTTTHDDSNLKLLMDKSFLNVAVGKGCNVYGKFVWRYYNSFFVIYFCFAIEGGWG